MDDISLENELNVYGADAENIFLLKEVRDSKHKSQIRILRVMHSNSLCSIKGIETFPNLEEVNLSSNNLKTMEGLNTLPNLRTLNISCNCISRIGNLNGLFYLRAIDLSHNRIYNIQAFYSVGFGINHRLMQNILFKFSV